MCVHSFVLFIEAGSTGERHACRMDAHMDVQIMSETRGLQAAAAVGLEEMSLSTCFWPDWLPPTRHGVGTVQAHAHHVPWSGDEVHPWLPTYSSRSCTDKHRTTTWLFSFSGVFLSKLFSRHQIQSGGVCIN